MDDLVKRLLDYDNCNDDDVDEAANEITRLRREWDAIAAELEARDKLIISQQIEIERLRGEINTAIFWRDLSEDKADEMFSRNEQLRRLLQEADEKNVSVGWFQRVREALKDE